MSYLVLARKWRPQLFSDVVGQPHVIRILQNAIKADRLAHAYLFSGPRGVGKTSVARILSKAINCELGVNPEPCCKCKNCLDISSGKSPDVIEIDGASHRGIDSIRSLQEAIAYKPIRSRYKIYIIDEVHMLTNEAFNALLKTLEEPPPHVKFIFATTDPHKLPLTVVSRCQRFEFRRIPVSSITSHLLKICEAEGFQVSADIIGAVAREAEGSMRDAETLLEQVISFQGEDIPADELLDILGIVDKATLTNAINAVVDSDYARCIELAQNIYERGIDCGKFCNRLLELVQHMLLIALDTPEKEKITDLEELRNIASRTNPETLKMYYEIILKAAEQTKRSSDPYFVIEAMLLKLASVPQLIAIPDILQHLQGSHSSARSTVAERNSLNRSVDGYRKQSFTTIGSASKTGDVIAQWRDFLNWLNTKEPLIKAQLDKSKPVKVSSEEYHIQVIPFYKEILNQPDKIELLKGLIKEFFNLSSVSIKIEADEQLNSQKKLHNSGEHSQEDMQQVVYQHPVVKDALEILGGRIVEIRRIANNTQKQKDVLLEQCEATEGDGNGKNV